MRRVLLCASVRNKIFTFRISVERETDLDEQKNISQKSETGSIRCESYTVGEEIAETGTPSNQSVICYELVK